MRWLVIHSYEMLFVLVYTILELVEKKAKSFQKEMILFKFELIEEEDCAGLVPYSRCAKEAVEHFSFS
jgi:hypothetical protein